MSSNQLTKEKSALIFLLVVFLVAFFYIMRPFLMPVILAAVLAIIFHPIYLKINLKFKNKPNLSAFLTTLLVFVIFIIPTAVIITNLINQTAKLINTLNLNNTFSELYLTEVYKTYILPFLTSLEEQLPFKIDILGWMTEFGKQFAIYLSNFSLSILVGTPRFIFEFFIMIVTLFFLLITGADLLKMIFDISPLRQAHEKQLALQFKKMIDATIYGYLVTSFVQGCLAGIIFKISGVESYFVLGALTFFMSMVPVIGATGVWLPVSLWFFLQGDNTWGFVNLIYGALIISGIDNFLKPIIIREHSQMHPLVVFFSLFGGISLFGPVGILFGPIITAMLIATLTIYRKDYI